MCQITKHVHAKYQLSSFYPDLAKFLTFFTEIFRIFQKNLEQISKNSKSEYAVLCLNMVNKASSLKISAF
jgi:hypothetical protein